MESKLARNILKEGGIMCVLILKHFCLSRVDQVEEKIVELRQIPLVSLVPGAVYVFSKMPTQLLKEDYLIPDGPVVPPKTQLTC